MGTSFTHYSPFSDEDGLDLQTRFATKINSIDDNARNLYCIFISDDKCHKFKINGTKEPIEMKDYTPLKLFKYIFGNIFKNYIDSPEYKNMSEAELEQICNDFAEHLKTTSNVKIIDALDVERERFIVKFPNNAFAKYTDHSKLLFSRIIDADTRETMYMYFPIQIVEEADSKRYDVVLKYREKRNISIIGFNPFDDNGVADDCMIDDMTQFANAILTDLKNSCILHISHISKNKICIEFIGEKAAFEYIQTPQEFYRIIFGEMFKDYITDENYKNMTDDELENICNDFALYLEYFKTTTIDGENCKDDKDDKDDEDCKDNKYDDCNKDINTDINKDINAETYAFHTLFPNNGFSKCIREKYKTYIPKYMCKIIGIKKDNLITKVKYHYLPLAIISNDKTYNVLIEYN
jgi:hypothetical protein